MSKLTKAQRAFLKQLRCFRQGRRYEPMNLTGSEIAMANRLVERGLCALGNQLHSDGAEILMAGVVYRITPAGRAALEQG